MNRRRESLQTAARKGAWSSAEYKSFDTEILHDKTQWTSMDKIIMMFPALWDFHHPEFFKRKLVNSYKCQLLEKLERERKRKRFWEEPITNENIKTKIESFKRKLRRRRQSFQKNASQTTSESDNAEEMELWVLEDDESFEHEDPQVAVEDVKSVEDPSQANIDHVKFVVLANDDTIQREGLSLANIEEVMNDNTMEYEKSSQANIGNVKLMKNDILSAMNIPKVPSAIELPDWTRTDRIIMLFPALFDKNHPQFRNRNLVNSYRSQLLEKLESESKKYYPLVESVETIETVKTKIESFKRKLRRRRRQSLQINASKRTSKPDTAEETWVLEDEETVEYEDHQVAVEDVKSVEGPSQVNIEHLKFVVLANNDTTQRKGFSKSNIENENPKAFVNDNTSEHKDPQANIEEANSEVFVNDNTIQYEDPLQSNIEDENSMILANDNTIEHENPQANKVGKLTILVNNYTFEYVGPLQANEHVNPVFANDSTSVYKDPQVNIVEVKEEEFVNNETYECPSEANIEDINPMVFENDNNSVYKDSLQANIEDVNPVFANDSTSVYVDPQVDIEEVKEEVFVNDETYECPSEANIEDMIFENDNRTNRDPLQANIEDVKPVVACRGCLVTEQPLRPLDHKLANAYGLLISTVEQNDIYPKYICTYCRALLLRFTSFREKCLSAQAALDKIHSEGTQITMDLIQGIQKPAYPFQTQTSLISLDDQNQYSTNTKGESDSCADDSEHNDTVLKDSGTELNDFTPAYNENIDKGGTANEQVTDLPQDFESEIGETIICKAPQEFLSTIEEIISKNVFESTPSTSEPLIDLSSVKIPIEPINEGIEENFVRNKNFAPNKRLNLKNKLECPKFAPYYVKIKPINSEDKETRATTFQCFKKISKNKRVHQSNRDIFNIVKIAPKPTQSVPKSSKRVVMDNTQTVQSATKSEDTTTNRTQTQLTLNDILERIKLNDIGDPNA